MRHRNSAAISLILVSLGICLPAAAQEKKNLAYDKPAATVPARLTEQSRKMEQRVFKVTKCLATKTSRHKVRLR